MKAVSDNVVFGHMHEDHSLELSLVDRLPLRRALVIASGGDLAFALAGEEAGGDWRSIPIPAQIELVRLKMQCPPNLAELCFRGQGGPDVPLGWAGSCLDFRLAGDASRVGFRGFSSGLSGGNSPAGGCSLIHGRRAGARLNRDAIRLIRRRLERAMRKPDAGNNPLLQVLLGNRFGPELPEVWSNRGIEKWRSRDWQDRIENRGYRAVSPRLSRRFVRVDFREQSSRCDGDG